MAGVTADKRASAIHRTARKTEHRLRRMRLKHGLTQSRLAELCGMHRNTIVKLENGTTREVTPDHAAALAAALKTSVTELALRVRAANEAPSIRLRHLTPEQRSIVDQLLSLPPEDYVLVRAAIEALRETRKRKRGAGPRR